MTVSISTNHRAAQAGRAVRRLPDVPGGWEATRRPEGWLDLQRRGATVCRDDPGLPVDLHVTAPTRQLLRWLHGRVRFPALVAAEEAHVLGPSRLVRAFPTWFETGLFADGLARRERREASVAPA